MQPDIKDKLTLIELAAYIGRSRTRAWQLVSQGIIPGEKAGRDWFVKVSDARIYMQGREGTAA